MADRCCSRTGRCDDVGATPTLGPLLVTGVASVVGCTTAEDGGGEAPAGIIVSDGRAEGEGEPDEGDGVIACCEGVAGCGAEVMVGGDVAAGGGTVGGTVGGKGRVGIAVAWAGSAGVGVGGSGDGPAVGCVWRWTPACAAIASIDVAGKPLAPAVHDQPSTSPSWILRFDTPTVCNTHVPSGVKR